MSDDTPVLACPHCLLPLLLSPTGAACANGHSFDRARGGYLNLAIGGRIGSKVTPGDAPDALAARRRFLAGGHYAPIAQALAAAVGRPQGPVLDVGCGEGYYLSQLSVARRYGLDVSKSAVQLAARLLPDAQFVVGSAYRLPVLDGSVAVVMSVFAPHPFEEFQRVLQPGGKWVTVTPGPRHLHELRPVLQGDSERKAQERFQRRAVPPDEAATSVHVEYELHLLPEALAELFHMTPIRWQAGAAARAGMGAGGGGAAAAPAVVPSVVTVDVWVSSSH
ncbi:MAG: methyltransferase domain-containing protein [Actinomycetota bacterium]|nr:methyltransferase domain-containing protein [Actinomycetota bacterium]